MVGRLSWTTACPIHRTVMEAMDRLRSRGKVSTLRIESWSQGRWVKRRLSCVPRLRCLDRAKAAIMEVCSREVALMSNWLAHLRLRLWKVRTSKLHLSLELAILEGSFKRATSCSSSAGKQWLRVMVRAVTWRLVVMVRFSSPICQLSEDFRSFSQKIRL